MATEFAFDDEILVLDGRVLEIFHRDVDESAHYHVAPVSGCGWPRVPVGRVPDPSARTRSPPATVADADPATRGRLRG